MTFFNPDKKLENKFDVKELDNRRRMGDPYLALVKRDCSLLFMTADVVWWRYMTQMASPKKMKLACNRIKKLIKSCSIKVEVNLTYG